MTFFPCTECGAYMKHTPLCKADRDVRPEHTTEVPIGAKLVDEKAVKADEGKPNLALLVWLPLGPALAVGRVLEYGAKKYAPLNYRKGFKRTRLLAACLRHVFAYLAGQDKDPATGESNLAHAIAALMMCMQNELDGKGEDDREKGLQEIWEEKS